MGDEPADKSLREVISLVHSGHWEAAFGRLRNIDTDRLCPRDLGRALAVEVVCAMQSEGDEETAYAVLRDVLDRCRGDRESVLALGIQLSEIEEHDEFAETALRHLCDIDPHSHVPRYNLAAVLERAERYEEALAAHDAAVEREPGLAPSHRGRAACLREIGRLGEAAQAYRRYLALKPDDAVEWVSLAIVESDQGNHDQAYEAYEHGKRLDAESADLYYNWLITALRRPSPDHEKARECAEELARIAPNDWRSAMGRAFLAEVGGRASEGWKECELSFDMACREDEPDARAAAAQAALSYAEGNGLAEQARGLIERIFGAGTFTEDVFAIVRRLEGNRSSSAVDHYVLIEGVITDPQDEGLPLQGDDRTEGPYGYYRSYRVYAESADQAAAWALEFERRYRTGSDQRVESVEKMSGAEETYMGIAWCSGQLIYSADTRHSD